MKKTEYPLVVLKETKSLFKGLERIAISNSELVEGYNNYSAYLSFRLKSEHNFYFSVYEPTYKPAFITFRIKIKPISETDNTESSYNHTYTDIIEKFEQWIDLMKEYDSFSFSDDETIIKQYEEEFYTEWEILDEDADEKAFEPDRQILLYNWLTLLERDLKSNHSLGKENPLAEEAAELKDNIQNLTKRQFVIRFAKLMSKVKKTGLKLLSEIFDIAKKEALKKLLYGGIEEIGDITKHLL